MSEKNMKPVKFITSPKWVEDALYTALLQCKIYPYEVKIFGEIGERVLDRFYTLPDGYKILREEDPDFAGRDYTPHVKIEDYLK